MVVRNVGIDAKEAPESLDVRRAHRSTPQPVSVNRGTVGLNRIDELPGTDVDDADFVVLPTELRVPAGHGGVVEKDVEITARNMSSRR